MDKTVELESATTRSAPRTRTTTTKASPPGSPSPRSRARKGGKTDAKTFVLDTNVLIHNPNALFVFEDNDIVVPFTVLEELDSFKSLNNDVGRASRECIRFLDQLRLRGPLFEGVRLGTPDEPVIEAAGSLRPTGTVRILTFEAASTHGALNTEKPDNRILGVAHALYEAGERVVFVSKDINARLKADALGIAAEDFENQKVNVDRLYSGYLNAPVDGELIDEMYREEMLPVDLVTEALSRIATDDGPTNGAGNGDAKVAIQPNQYIILTDATDESHTGIGRRLSNTDHIIPVGSPRRPVFGIMARNVQQVMALDLLLNPEIQLVTMIGSAGTGKTLLAVAAGMAQVFGSPNLSNQRQGEASRYDKLLVARPIMPMGRDIGYLPGDKDEKLNAWMQPIFDNLAYLLSTRAASSNEPHSHTTEQQLNKFMADGRLVLEPLTYIRGRSIPHQYIIVDEAQNLSPHEVKTIVSRVGEGTKIVLTGDIDQIDNPYLDSSSNGLSYAVERMKGASMVGHITLAKSERSALASLAIERL